MALQRMEHQGAAPATGVQAHIASGDTSFTILSGTGYPTGSVGPFILCIDPGTASEEKILCASRSGTTVTVAGSGRGYDGTSASAHSVGTTNVQHVLGAIEVDDDNDHVYTTTRDDHTQYARTDGTRAITGTQHFSSQIVVASGSTITTGGETISAGGLTVTAGGISVAAGTTAVQALTATTITGTGALGGVTTITGSGEVKGTDFNATGLTGATAGTRYVGSTASGAPGSGTFVTGDFVVDQTGSFWVCTSGGTPGTWVGGQDASWTSVGSFTNSWASVVTPAYRKVGTRVYVRGQINGGAIGNAAFTLPVGYRPTQAVRVACSSNNTGTFTAGEATVSTAGVVVPAAGTGVTFFSLDTIQFDTI